MVFLLFKKYIMGRFLFARKYKFRVTARSYTREPSLRAIGLRELMRNTGVAGQLRSNPDSDLLSDSDY
jgi:hypothetical protein